MLYLTLGNEQKLFNSQSSPNVIEINQDQLIEWQAWPPLKMRWLLKNLGNLSENQSWGSKYLIPWISAFVERWYIFLNCHQMQLLSVKW